MSENEVGTNAGNILNLLSDKGNLSIREIGEHTNCRDKVIFLALGWLLRENKINCFERNGSLCVESKFTQMSEIYY